MFEAHFEFDLMRSSGLWLLQERNKNDSTIQSNWNLRYTKKYIEEKTTEYNYTHTHTHTINLS